MQSIYIFSIYYNYWLAAILKLVGFFFCFFFFGFLGIYLFIFNFFKFYFIFKLYITVLVVVLNLRFQCFMHGNSLFFFRMKEYTTWGGDGQSELKSMAL